KNWIEKKQERKIKSEQLQILFFNLKGKVSSTDSGGIITKTVFFTFDVKNKSATEQTLVKITNAQLKVIADDNSEYDFVAYNKTMQIADFKNKPLELPIIQPKQSVNNHITFSYRNLQLNPKSARIKINYTYIDDNDKEVKEETEWLEVHLEKEQIK
ncbi:MAG: hypothetical protein ACFFDW_15270, partial [Candidatus Thorarchaeota archaeon]